MKFLFNLSFACPTDLSTAVMKPVALSHMFHTMFVMSASRCAVQCFIMCIMLCGPLPHSSVISTSRGLNLKLERTGWCPALSLAADDGLHGGGILLYKVW